MREKPENREGRGERARGDWAGWCGGGASASGGSSHIGMIRGIGFSPERETWPGCVNRALRFEPGYLYFQQERALISFRHVPAPRRPPDFLHRIRHVRPPLATLLLRLHDGPEPPPQVCQILKQLHLAHHCLHRLCCRCCFVQGFKIRPHECSFRVASRQQAKVRHTLATVAHSSRTLVERVGDVTGGVVVAAAGGGGRAEGRGKRGGRTVVGGSSWGGPGGGRSPRWGGSANPTPLLTTRSLSVTPCRLACGSER